MWIFIYYHSELGPQSVGGVLVYTYDKKEGEYTEFDRLMGTGDEFSFFGHATGT